MDARKNLSQEFTLFTTLSRTLRSKASEIAILRGWSLSDHSSTTIFLGAKFLKEREGLSTIQYAYVSRILAFLTESQTEFHSDTHRSLFDDFMLHKKIHLRSYSKVNFNEKESMDEESENNDADIE